MVIADIHSLVQSLNSREAAYFTDFLAKGKIQDSDFFQWLFKEIRKQDVYNEKQITDQVKDKLLKSNFSKTKHRFASYLFDSLVAYHAKSSITCKIHRLTEIAWLLFYKRLYTQSMNMLDEAKAEALKYEKHYLLLEICELERKLLMQTSSADMLQKLNKNSTDKTELFEIIQNEDSFAAINNKVFLLYRELSLAKDKFNQAELEKLISLKLLSDESHALSFEARMKFHYIHAVYSRLTGDFKKLLYHREQEMKLWDQHPHLIIEMPVRYREDLCNLLSARHLMQDYKDFDQLIERIENQKTTASPEEDASVFREVYYLRQLYLLNNGKRKEALNLIPVIEKGLIQHEKFIGQARMYNFWNNIAVTCFLNQKYKETLDWVNKLLAIERTSKVRNDLREFAQIFEIVLRFELGRYDLVEYRIRNIRDRLKKNDRLYQFEDIVLSSLKRLLSAIHEKGKASDAWKDFLQKLDQLGQQPGMENLIGLEEISIWVRGKIS